jgi:hypothetical protein
MADREPAASTLLLDEFFATGDERFLGEVFACRVPAKLKSLAEPWYRDARPLARAALVAYVEDGCDRAGHRALVKMLFRVAEAAEDDELMGRFMVAFDRLARRALVEMPRWDWEAGIVRTEVRLCREPGVPASLAAATRAGRFSMATRRYLARRAFRYFRRLGFADVGRYGRAVRAALARYEDTALDRPERLLDAWGLVHALYWASPVLVRKPRGIRVAEGRMLAELVPAPIHPTAWRGCFDEVLALAREARSRTVRQWAAALLRKAYARELASLRARDARVLLASPHDEVRALGADVLRGAEDLGRLAAAEWLELLKLPSPEAASLVADLASRHLAADRVSLADAVALARAPVAPVAELGLRIAREHEVADAEALTNVLELRDAPVATVRREAARWLAALVRDSAFARAEHARDLVDSRHADVRAEGLALLYVGSPFSRDLGLAAALSESPYADVRAWLVGRLGEWEREVEPGTLCHMWATAMLSVGRGARVKRCVLDQISERLAERPDEADLLLPILAVALRSARAAERRAALASVARAARRAPALAPALARHIPELRLAAEAAR